MKIIRKIKRMYTKFLYKLFRKQIMMEGQRHIQVNTCKYDVLTMRHLISPMDIRRLHENLSYDKERTIEEMQTMCREKIAMQTMDFVKIEVIENGRIYPNIEIRAELIVAKKQ